MKGISKKMALVLFLGGLVLVANRVEAHDRLDYLMGSGHVQNIGWLPMVEEGERIGTTGRNLRLEAINLTLGNQYQGNLTYQAYVAKLGWLPIVSSGQVAGTVGKGLQMEAVKVALTGEIATHYRVVYRAHVANLGWLPWVVDGNLAGTTGRGLRLEALEIKLVAK